MRNSIWLRGNEVVPGIWHSLYSPRSRTSNTANKRSDAIKSAKSWQEIDEPIMSSTANKQDATSGLTYPRNLFYLCSAENSSAVSIRRGGFYGNLHDRFSGLFIPHVTPFESPALSIWKASHRLTKYFASLPGVAGLVSCARIGESPVLSIEEKRQVYEISGKIAHKAGKVHIATIAPQSTDEAVKLMRDLENLPVDGVMIFPPLLFAWGKVDPNLKSVFSKIWRAKPNYRWCSSKYRSKAITMIRKPFAASPVLKTSSHSKKRPSTSICSRETVQALKRDKAAMRVLTGNDRFVAESYGSAPTARSSAWPTSRRKNGPPWIPPDAPANSTSRRDPERAGILKELVFSEPIVEAVARIKIVLQHEGLIKTANVRRPQLGMSEAEKRQLLDSYAVLKRNEFRNGATTSQDKRRQAVG